MRSHGDLKAEAILDKLVDTLAEAKAATFGGSLEDLKAE